MKRTLFKRLSSGAMLPQKATQGSVAYDLYAPEDFIVKQGRSILPLGFAIEMEHIDGWQQEAKIEARSGFSSKGMEGFRLYEFTNTKDNDDVVNLIAMESELFDADVLPGKVDEDYRGEVGVIINNHDCAFVIKKGTRIAQMTFYAAEETDIEWAEELSETSRGDGGFGKSGVMENNYEQK